MKNQGRGWDLPGQGPSIPILSGGDEHAHVWMKNKKNDVRREERDRTPLPFLSFQDAPIPSRHLAFSRAFVVGPSFGFPFRNVPIGFGESKELLPVSIGKDDPFRNRMYERTWSIGTRNVPSVPPLCYRFGDPVPDGSTFSIDSDTKAHHSASSEARAREPIACSRPSRKRSREDRSRFASCVGRSRSIAVSRARIRTSLSGVRVVSSQEWCWFRGRKVSVRRARHARRSTERGEKEGLWRLGKDEEVVASTRTAESFGCWKEISRNPREGRLKIPREPHHTLLLHVSMHALPSVF